MTQRPNRYEWRKKSPVQRQLRWLSRKTSVRSTAIIKDKWQREVEGQSRASIVCCGDFSAYSTLWGSERTDGSDQVIEDLLDERNLMCLNDGNKTRIDVNTGKESVLDFTLVSHNIGLICDCKVYQEGTVGSDHYPVLCEINIHASVTEVSRGGKLGVGELW